MELIYEGKTKQVLREDRHLVMRFKDTLLGGSSGSPNPGGNQSVGEKEGKGEAAAQATAYFFNLLEENGFSTHFVEVESPREIKVRPTERYDLEVIYREKAYGSFLSRYDGYTEPFQDLRVIEFSLKDDELKDPFISKEAVSELGLAKSEEIQKMKKTTKEIAKKIREKLSEENLELVDMKLEFGKEQGKFLVIDEISGNTMRVYEPKQERILNQKELSERLGLI